MLAEGFACTNGFCISDTVLPLSSSGCVKAVLSQSFPMQADSLVYLAWHEMVLQNTIAYSCNQLGKTARQTLFANGIPDVSSVGAQHSTSLFNNNVGSSTQDASGPCNSPDSPSLAQCSAAQHSTAQHSTAQHSTAQHGMTPCGFDHTSSQAWSWLQVTGSITYNGRGFDQFRAAHTAAYVDQNDLHQPELTVRETFDFAARCQGVGHKAGEASFLSSGHAGRRQGCSVFVSALLVLLNKVMCNWHGAAA